MVQRNNIYWQDVFNSWLCYSKNLTSNDDVPTVINRWNAEICDTLPNDLCVQDNSKICSRTTDVSTVKLLQEKIRHRINFANYYLKKIKITTSDCCIFCNDMFETTQHVFLRHVRRYYHCGMHLVYLYMKSATKPVEQNI